MLCSAGVFPSGEKGHAGPEPEGDHRAAGLLCLQLQDGGGPKWDPVTAESL